jgi:flagellar biosynthesis protein FlhB
VSASGQDRTEKATPKKRDDARKKGQVARSMDLNGAVVLLASLMALSAFGPRLLEQLQGSMRQTLMLMSTPSVVSREGIGELLATTMGSAAKAAAPIIAVCLVIGVLVNLAQVRWKPSAQAMKPMPTRLNPLKGAKNIFGPHFVFEGAKTFAKLAVIGAIAAFAVFPKLDELAGLVGMPPAELVSTLAHTVLGIAQRAGIAYLVIAFIDYAWQRHRHEKQLKMTKQEVKDEAKQQNTPPEVRAALKRRQMEQARKRMMDAVPEADVVVTNPIHFAVALKYDGQKASPEVVAKGKDLIAAKIRRLAEAHDVPVVEDAPLARSLHAAVEVGQEIPEQFFQAVAQLLAYVYRMAGRKAAA